VGDQGGKQIARAGCTGGEPENRAIALRKGGQKKEHGGAVKRFASMGKRGRKTTSVSHGESKRGGKRVGMSSRTRKNGGKKTN